jgi:V/A-type H+-transporting ATPase subunit I
VILRPSTASWFELLTAREELGAALDCLAATGAVQLQAHSSAESRLALPDLRVTLIEFETLSRRYAHYWPAPVMRPPAADRDLLETPRVALGEVRAWSAEAQPLIAELESLEAQRTDVELLYDLRQHSADSLPRLDRVAAAGPVLAGRIYALPADGQTQALPPTVLLQRVAGTSGEFMVAVGPREEIAALDQALAARKARGVALPTDLPADPAAVGAFLAERRNAIEARRRAASESLDIVARQHHLAESLGELALAAWLVSHVPELPVTEHFAWVTGWCSDADDHRLKVALDARGLHYLLRVMPAPPGSEPPSVLHNPAWARPFEVFAGLMGVPGTRDADPSVIVAILAPLMFGFMFGDVLQGLAVSVAGFVLRKRLPALGLLVPGGLVAIVFGFAFGSILAREDVIPAFWVRPLEQPLTVLGTALAFGAIVLVVGLLLNALQFLWRGEIKGWVAAEAGTLVAYLGLVGTVVDSRALWALPAGLAWAVAGPAIVAEGDRAVAAGHAAGEMLERMLQLGVNTVSFVRVGAFALAHAGLCTAVVGMAEASGPGYWPVLIVGNAAIIGLEGLVVSIQTTRLILFEFFIRFLTARGRPFEPLPPPVPTPNPISGSKP